MGNEHDRDFYSIFLLFWKSEWRLEPLILSTFTRRMVMLSMLQSWCACAWHQDNRSPTNQNSSNYLNPILMVNDTCPKSLHAQNMQSDFRSMDPSIGRANIPHRLIRNRFFSFIVYRCIATCYL